MTGRPVVTYYGIYDMDYPRNTRVRAYLEAAGYDVRAHTKSRSESTVRRWIEDLRDLRRLMPQTDVLVVSEFSTKYALFARVLGGRKVIISDGFVGLHETRIEDWAIASKRSLRSAIYRVLDWLAVRASDLYLIDNDYRAAALRQRYGRRAGRGRIVTLPVGAPSWASPIATHPSQAHASDVLHVLYYGNYIPLHGLPLVVTALEQASHFREIDVTFVGDGKIRPAIEAQVAEVVGLRYRFCAPVPAADLATYIAESDIVLGVFGSSPKAQSVIANKVWQGLASGRVVVTQETPALEEIAGIVGAQLVMTQPGDASSLAKALVEYVPMPSEPGDTAMLLEKYVESRFGEFGALLAEVLARRERAE